MHNTLLKLERQLLEYNLKNKFLFENIQKLYEVAIRNEIIRKIFNESK